MPGRRIRLRSSIGLTLFKRVFGVYCLVALLITAAHVLLEYRNTEQRIGEELVGIQSMVDESIAGALWELDMRQLDRILTGMVERPEVVGVSVLGPQQEVLGRRGTLPEAERALLETTLLGDEALRTPIRYDDAVFGHRFTVRNPSDLRDEVIGEVRVYSHPDVVLAQVADTFSWILVAALIKTAALWAIFVLVGHRLLARPLSRLVGEVEELRRTQLDAAVDSELEADNELHLLQLRFESMAQQLGLTLAELNEANRRLSSSNWQLQRAIDQSPAMITVFDTAGRIQYTNPSFRRITGYPPEEAQAAYDAGVFEGCPLPALRAGLDQGGPDRLRGEVHCTARGGEQHWLSCIVSAVRGPEGEVSQYLCTAIDISARKAVESALEVKTLEQQQTIRKLEDAHHQLLQSEKMASIGQLAAGVAHEINNPVGYVNSNLNSLKQYIRDITSLVDRYREGAACQPPDFSAAAAHAQSIDYDFLREDLDALMQESQEGLLRVKQIIKDLKDFSHQDKGEWVLSDLRQGMESTLNVVWNELKYKCEIHREFEAVPQIQCVPSQLNQVFMNLLVNAAHAIDEKGTITLRMRKEPGGVAVEVEDTGRGVAPEHLDRLFEPFFTTKPVGVGTGLGLSVSYGIIKSHGGTIEVESEPGRGTLFRIRLPLCQPEGASAEPMDQEAMRT